jgi:extradiol dioxygenase family protein
VEINTTTIGAAGELRVMSELMLKGFNPAKSYLDNGIDLILENGKKIQVKTSRKLLKHCGVKSKHYGYFFSFQDWKNKKRELNIDFIICWCIEDNIFFIIPKAELKAVGLSFIPSGNENRLRKYIDNWSVLN